MEAVENVTQNILYFFMNYNGHNTVELISYKDRF